MSIQTREYHGEVLIHEHMSISCSVPVISINNHVFCQYLHIMPVNYQDQWSQVLGHSLDVVIRLQSMVSGYVVHVGLTG